MTSPLRPASTLVTLAVLAGTGALGQSASFQLPGVGQVISGSNVTRTVPCGGGPLSLAGDNNRLTVTGTCTQFTVSGNRNTVKLAVTGPITVSGRGNTVTWHQAVKGAAPLVKTSGSGNRVTRN